MTNASSADETVDLMPDLNAAAMANGFLRVLARSCTLCLCEGSLAPLAANVCSDDAFKTVDSSGGPDSVQKECNVAAALLSDSSPARELTALPASSGCNEKYTLNSERPRPYFPTTWQRPALR